MSKCQHMDYKSDWGVDADDIRRFWVFLVILLSIVIIALNWTSVNIWNKEKKPIITTTTTIVTTIYTITATTTNTIVTKISQTFFFCWDFLKIPILRHKYGWMASLHHISYGHVQTLATLHIHFITYINLCPVFWLILAWIIFSILPLRLR